MRWLAWTAALRREFGVPVALSVAIHGVVGAALGAYSFSVREAPAHPVGLMVELVALQPEPVVPPAAEPPKLVLRTLPARQASPAAMKRMARKAAAPLRAHVRHVPPAQAPVPVAPVPVTPVTPPPASEHTPTFRDLPRVLAPAPAPTAALPQTVSFSEPDLMEPQLLLTATVGSASLSRRLPVAVSGPSRLLRDPTAESSVVRSKVRPGNNPRPEYPRAAREAGWEGTVVLQVVVLPDGTADAVTVHKASGYVVLDDAAISAVRNWRFIPAMDGNFPVRSVVRLPIRFDLQAAN